MSQTKNYKTKLNESTEEKILVNVSDKLSIKDINKICNSNSQYFINKSSSILINIYLLTILLVILAATAIFIFYAV